MMKVRPALLSLALLLSPGLASAHDGPVDHEHHGTGPTHDEASAHDESSAHGHGDLPGHGSAHGHVPHFADINWFTGLIGEREGVEPGLLWRAPGTPVPLGALLLNTAILFYFLGRLGGPAIKKGLVDRKKRIAGDIEAASAMKAEAEEQLAHYETQLAQMTAEMERIKADMREQAALERERILNEAKSRREGLEREAHVLITQELSAAREAIAQTVAREAIAVARKLIAQSLDERDHERLAHDLLSSVESNIKPELRS